ncbi:MAG: hypothetical protein R6V12_02045, partial [Candidatus Hydrogenedentota bacterium]
MSRRAWRSQGEGTEETRTDTDDMDGVDGAWRGAVRGRQVWEGRGLETTRGRVVVGAVDGAWRGAVRGRQVWGGR